MSQSVLMEKPPVLVDIGASGHLHEAWQLIAPYSICVAFDADTRDFSVGEFENKGWKKLYSINRIVAVNNEEEINFYLTKSPHCSSSLAPNKIALTPWAFRDLFEIDKKVKIPVVKLQEALAKIGISYIDWYKTDSQGTDLRIFDSLSDDIKYKMIAAEFEPGIIDAYLGEDKLPQLMEYMEKLPYWITQMQLKGSHRIDQVDFDAMNFIQKRSIDAFLKIAPGWCEISYLNNLNSDYLSLREYFLAWIFSTIKGEHGFALRIARTGNEKFKNELLSELYTTSSKSLARGYMKFSGKIVKKVTKKMLGR